jgi:GxxExxY protein
LFQVPFRGAQIGRFRADLIVDSRVLIEVKSSALLDPSAEARVLDYLRATDLELGLLSHFGRTPAFKRLIFTNDREHQP